MPQVSIILPTYNRADTIQRAIRSIQAQTYQDWELIVVDDGSADNTSALVANLDPRLILIRQENQGVTQARNTALQRSTGKYLAFLDSDDEWLPHHLELCLAFLEAHPAEYFVGCELLEDFGGNRYLSHYQTELQDWYPQVAKLTGSRLLDLPAGEDDDYLRVYAGREPIGAWGRQIIEQGGQPDARRYYGHIFEHWRWGFLMWLPSTVLRREVLDQIGYFDQNYPICSDFTWLAECCRRFQANYLSVATGIKHEMAPSGRPLTEGHIAKGKTQHVGVEDIVHYFEKNYWEQHPNSPELSALRSHKQFYTAQILMGRGLRDRALAYLKEAQAHSPQPWRVFALRWFATIISSDELCRRVYAAWCQAIHAVELLRAGEITLNDLADKLITKLTETLRSLSRSVLADLRTKRQP